MSSAQQRKDLLELIAQACTGGARLNRACTQIGLSERTVQRWQHPDGQDGDRRASDLHERAEPHNKLGAFERQAAMTLLNGEDLKKPAAEPNRAAPGRSGALHRQRIYPLPAAAPSRPNKAPQA